MEDWLYAAGWDKSELKRCQGDFKGVEDVQNRAIVFLVETSDRKKPHDDSLGGPHLVSHYVLSYNRPLYYYKNNMKKVHTRHFTHVI